MRAPAWFSVDDPTRVLGSVLVVAIVAVTAPIGYSVATLAYREGGAVGVVLTLVVIALVGATTAPVHILPSCALVLYVLLPQQLIGYGYLGLTPALLIMLVWVTRRLATAAPEYSRALDQWWLGARIAAVLLILWILYLIQARSRIVSDSGPSAGEWAISFIVGALLVLFVRVSSTEADLLVRTLAAVTVCAAIFAVGEVVLQDNPIYLPLYESVGRGLPTDEALHRSSVSFGHPLYAGTFFAVSFAIFFVRWIDHIPRSLIPLIAAIAGVASTISRGALAVAATVAVIVTIVRLPRLWRARSPKPLRLLALAPLAVAAVAASGLVEARTGTAEAVRSSEVRGDNIAEAIALASRFDWAGSGPASADSLTLAHSGGAYPMENSLLQIVISLGLPGLILLLTTLTFALVSAVVSGADAGAASLAAFIAVTAGYNGLEGLLPLHSLLGLVVLLCFAGSSLRNGPDPSTAAYAASEAPKTLNGVA